MANTKKETPSLEFQIEELKRKIEQKDVDIKQVTERMQKETELVEFHKAKVKKYSDDIRILNLQNKGLSMDLMDLRADMAQIDREKYFESAMIAADKNMPKAEPEKTVEGANAPSTAPDADSSKADSEINDPEKNESSTKKDDEQPQSIDSTNPLEKARAEFNKKHPDGFSIAERSKKR